MLSALITQNRPIYQRRGGEELWSDEYIYGIDCADGFTYLQTYQVVKAQLSVRQKIFLNLFAQ